MTEKQRRLYDYLSTGKHSVIDIMSSLMMADPRSIIRNLRENGIMVCDEWRRTVTGSKYKVYWIEDEKQG